MDNLIEQNMEVDVGFSADSVASQIDRLWATALLLHEETNNYAVPARSNWELYSSWLELKRQAEHILDTQPILDVRYLQIFFNNLLPTVKEFTTYYSLLLEDSVSRISGFVYGPWPRLVSKSESQKSSSSSHTSSKKMAKKNAELESPQNLEYELEYPHTSTTTGPAKVASGALDEITIKLVSSAHFSISSLSVNCVVSKFHCKKKSATLPQFEVLGNVHFDTARELIVIPGINFTKPCNLSTIRLKFTIHGHYLEEPGIEIQPYIIPQESTSTPAQHAGLFSLTLYSPPFTVTTNPNQWEDGEGRYLAYLTFGPESDTEELPEEAPWYRLFNCAQWLHLTATRQILSEYTYSALQASIKQKENSHRRARSETSERARRTYYGPLQKSQNHANLADFRRMLTVNELQSVFPNVANKISMETFNDSWPWYGHFMYKLYTGQTKGSIWRKLWLDHVLHLFKVKDALISLFPQDAERGYCLIRTSATLLGKFSVSWIDRAEAGNLEVRSWEVKDETKLQTQLNGNPAAQVLCKADGTCVNDIRLMLSNLFGTSPSDSREGYEETVELSSTT